MDSLSLSLSLSHKSKLFSSNPLSLSVPDAFFEYWLRDTGYLKILDERTTATAAAVAPPPPSVTASLLPTPTATTPALNTLTLAFSSFRTLAAVITLNPFAKLTPGDFSTPTPSWNLAFIGEDFCFVCKEIAEDFEVSGVAAETRQEEKGGASGGEYPFIHGEG